MSGVRRYCDVSALTVLRSLIAPYPYSGVHFIDIGDYHYMTKLWCEKIQKPFALVVFDHHPDMQPPAFGRILSCGSWVKEMLDTHSFLRKVVIIGVAEKFADMQEIAFYKVQIIDEASVRQDRAMNLLRALHFDVPIYISLDKDVLSRENIITNWSNGSLSLSVLCLMLQHLITSNSLLGVDICGGMEISDFVSCRQIIELNNRCDKKILSVLYNTKKASG
jgi:arginase family enzyme